MASPRANFAEWRTRSARKLGSVAALFSREFTLVFLQPGSRVFNLSHASNIFSERLAGYQISPPSFKQVVQDGASSRAAQPKQTG